MKVLFISNDPTIFDEKSVTRIRMRTYATLMEELHIVSPAKKGAIYVQEGNLFLYPVHAWKIFRMFMITRTAHIVCRKHEIQIISAQDPFEHGQAALRAMYGLPVLLHVQVHTDFLSPGFIEGDRRVRILNTYRRKIADKVLPLASGIRVVSQRVKMSLVARYGTRIVEPTVIPILVDATVPEAIPLPLPTFKFSLIAVGRLEPEKRIQDILHALKIISARYPMVGLYIVGSGGERKKLEKVVTDLDLEKKVVFLGERDDARALMKSAQAFIQASAYEGYGRTLIEAALAKVPIITTDVGVVGDVLKNEKEVLMVPVGDPAAIALAVEKLIEDNALRQMLPINAHEAAVAHLVTTGDFSTRITADLETALKHPL